MYIHIYIHMYIWNSADDSRYTPEGFWFSGSDPSASVTSVAAC